MQSFKAADFQFSILIILHLEALLLTTVCFLTKQVVLLLLDIIHFHVTTHFLRTIERNAGCDVRFDYDVISYEVQTSTSPHIDVKSIERLASPLLFVQYIYLVTGVFLVKSLSRFVVFQNQLKHKNLLIIWKR